MTDLIIVKDEGTIRTVRMNRPDKKNALNAPM
jgi:enoyl-CoA hydratase/carnithine racemase